MLKTIETKLETVMTHLNERHDFYASALVLGLFALALFNL